MIQLLSQNDIVTNNKFIDTFNISIETVRRDLNLLEKEGKIEKVYGGARLKEIVYSEPAMENRMISKLNQKKSIGKKCCEYIDNGHCIFIDSGSTTFQIAKYLADKENLTVITNSIPVINELCETDFEIIVIGGKIRKSERSVITYDYLFNFSQLNIHKSFICASGITLENGISDFSMQEALTRRMIIQRSKEIFVAADSSKFGKDVTVNITPLNSVDYIITDSKISPSFVNEFKSLNTELIIAD